MAGNAGKGGAGGGGAQARPALGRGLSALLPAAGAPLSAQRGLMTVPLDELSGEHKQPRRYWNLDALRDLAASIKAKGVIQPILVRKVPEGGYRVVAGERRMRAAREAGLKEVPVIVRDISEADAFELALIENIQREDLNPVEEAEAYHRLIAEHGLTQEQLSQRLGKERSTIANALRLLKLPSAVREHLASGTISPGHAKALIGLGDAGEIEAIARRVAADGLSVRDVEKLVQKKKDPPPPAKKDKARPLPRELTSLAKKVEKAYGIPCEVRLRGEESGEVVFRFASLAEGHELLGSLLAEAVDNVSTPREER